MSNARRFRRSLRANRVKAGRVASKRVIKASQESKAMRAQTTNTKEER